MASTSQACPHLQIHNKMQNFHFELTTSISSFKTFRSTGRGPGTLADDVLDVRLSLHELSISSDLAKYDVSSSSGKFDESDVTELESLLSSSSDLSPGSTTDSTTMSSV